MTQSRCQLTNKRYFEHVTKSKFLLTVRNTGGAACTGPFAFWALLSLEFRHRRFLLSKESLCGDGEPKTVMIFLKNFWAALMKHPHRTKICGETAGFFTMHTDTHH